MLLRFRLVARNLGAGPKTHSRQLRRLPEPAVPDLNAGLLAATSADCFRWSLARTTRIRKPEPRYRGAHWLTRTDAPPRQPRPRSNPAPTRVHTSPYAKVAPPHT